MHQIIPITLESGQKILYEVRKVYKRELDLIFKKIAAQKVKVNTSKGNLTSRIGKSP
jgi:hypothetical protein